MAPEARQSRPERGGDGVSADYEQRRAEMYEGAEKPSRSLMDAQAYRTALETLGLSQLAAGRWLGVSPKTAQNYATHGPSGPAARAIRMLLDMNEGDRRAALSTL